MDREPSGRNQRYVRENLAVRLPARHARAEPVVRGSRRLLCVLWPRRREDDWRRATGEIDERPGDAEFFPSARRPAADWQAVHRGRMQTERASRHDADRWVVEEKIRGGSEHCGASLV